MSKVKKIVLTGGGTAGHVTPNIALLPELKKQGYDVHYIGSYEGIERTLIKEQGIPYYGISSGKLRRYIDVKNLSDPFKVVKGLIGQNQAGCCVFQRWICVCTCRVGSKVSSHSLRDP